MKTSKHFLFLCTAVVLVLLLVSCKKENPQPPAHRGIYHWKSCFDPSKWEWDFIRDHKIDKLYIRLFDVVPNWVWDSDLHVYPAATTMFRQPLPADIEVVPVVYISDDAINKIWGEQRCSKYGALILERVDKMMTCQGRGDYKELQLDCDWALSNREEYFNLCEFLHKKLKERGVKLSSTVRVSQLTDESLHSMDVDRLVLMAYNTGNIRKQDTKNSILDTNDMAPYLQRMKKLSVPADVAYPLFGWGVAFDDAGRFERLISWENLPPEGNRKNIRVERGEKAQIVSAQKRLAPMLPDGDNDRTTILYHLDSANLINYSYEEIEDFYSR